MPVTIFEFIDLRSFSTIWFWLFLGAMWSRIMHAPLGVPVDLVREAERGRGRAMGDLAALSRVQAARQHAVSRAYGTWQVAAWAFVISALGMLGVGFRIEIAQAVLLLAAPLALVRLLEARAAARLVTGAPEGADLCRAHHRLRWKVQAIGFLAVFASAVWGMLHNLASYAF